MNGKNQRVMFSGNLLVPVGNNINLNFVWLGSISNSYNTVQIIAFKSNNREDFINLMKEDLEELNKLEATDNVVAQINWIKSTLAEVSNSVMVKKPEQPMFDAANKVVYDVLYRQGIVFNQWFTPENVIYTSGISGIYNE
jgi:hypothetical protein